MTSTLDVAFARVDYEGYVPTNAVTLTPGMTWNAPAGGISATGTMSRFASGHLSGVATAGGDWSVWNRDMSQLSAVGDGNLSTYQLGPGVVRERLGARLLTGLGPIQLWSTAVGGSVTEPKTTDGLVHVGGGATVAIAPLAVGASVVEHWLGGLRYADAEASARLVAGLFTANGVIGTRTPDGLSGRRTWAHLDVAFDVWRGLALTGTLGTLPRDPTLNTPGVRFAAIGAEIRVPDPPASAGAVRVPLPLTVREALERPPPPLRDADSNGPAASPTTAAGAAIEHQGAGRVLVVITAPGATRVELMGDFTHWEPVALARGHSDEWRATFVVEPGLHRFNVRLNGGSWRAPTGVAQGADDLGGVVGEFVGNQ